MLVAKRARNVAADDSGDLARIEHCGDVAGLIRELCGVEGHGLGPRRYALSDAGSYQSQCRKFYVVIFWKKDLYQDSEDLFSFVLIYFEIKWADEKALRSWQRP
jgi:hypothetical protein